MTSLTFGYHNKAMRYRILEGQVMFQGVRHFRISTGSVITMSSDDIALDVIRSRSDCQYSLIGPRNKPICQGRLTPPVLRSSGEIAVVVHRVPSSTRDAGMDK